MKFATKLRELRKAAGLTPYALAKKAGLTKQALYRLEESDNEPTWATVQKIAAALGVSCEAFQVEEEKPAASEPAKKTTRKRKEK
jgi:transcriptional regulator with XRE-family HTH domain